MNGKNREKNEEKIYAVCAGTSLVDPDRPMLEKNKTKKQLNRYGEYHACKRGKLKNYRRISSKNSYNIYNVQKLHSKTGHITYYVIRTTSIFRWYFIYMLLSIFNSSLNLLLTNAKCLLQYALS